MNAVKRDRFSTTKGTRQARLEPVAQSISQAKTRLLRDYSEAVSGDLRLLRLALNEAEALAWQTSFPQLFFHELAVEKARSVVQWHQQQRDVRRRALEIAFAE